MRNETVRLLDEKLPVLERALVTAARARGCVLVVASRRRKSRRLNPEPTDPGPALVRATAMGAREALLVSIQDFTAEPDARHVGDLMELRVDVTLCVSFRVLDCASGRTLDSRTIALCRRTTPIVAGTAVGSRVLDRFLAEVARQLAGRWGALRPAA